MISVDLFNSCQSEMIPLGEIGRVLGGVGAILIAMIAWITYRFIHWARKEEEWVDRFRQHYTEFWQDDNMAKVRRWIVNEQEYLHLEELLQKRIGNDIENTQPNRLSIEENQKLELVDRFVL